MPKVIETAKLGKVLLRQWDWGLFLLIYGFAAFLNSNSEVVNLSGEAMTLLIVPYSLLALNLVTDSIFYGVGKTRYMAIRPQSPTEPFMLLRSWLI